MPGRFHPTQGIYDIELFRAQMRDPHMGSMSDSHLGHIVRERHDAQDMDSSFGVTSKPLIDRLNKAKRLQRRQEKGP